MIFEIPGDIIVGDNARVSISETVLISTISSTIYSRHYVLSQIDVCLVIHCRDVMKMHKVIDSSSYRIQAFYRRG